MSLTTLNIVITGALVAAVLVAVLIRAYLRHDRQRFGSDAIIRALLEDHPEIVHGVRQLMPWQFDTFTRAATVWRLTTQQQHDLLGITDEKLAQWLADPDAVDLAEATLQRIADVLHILTHLHGFYGDVPAADRWPSRCNAHFAGDAPITRMCANAEGLREVLMYTRGMAG